MYSFARHDHGLAWVTLSAISLFVHGCGSMSADNPAGNGAAAGTESVSPASDTLFSTIETPDFGRYDLVARGPDDGSGEWQFAVRAGRGAPTKNELRFVWDFGDGKTYEGVEQSYSFTTNGSYVIKVTAIKLDGTVAFLLTLNVEVAIAVNEPPIADAGTNQTVDANALVFLYGGASSDPDGDPLTYQWVQISGEPVLLLHTNEPTASFIAPSIPQDADLVFGVTVGDGGYNEQDTVVVRVLRLVQPAETFLVTADAGADQLNVLQGTIVTLNGSGSRASDGSVLTYAWSQTSGPSVALTDAQQATASFTAPGIRVGTTVELIFELVATARDQSASDSVRVVVHDALSGGGDPQPVDPCTLDSDRDGVKDCDDRCPGADDKLDSDGDGIPDCLEALTRVVAAYSVQRVDVDGVLNPADNPAEWADANHYFMDATNVAQAGNVVQGTSTSASDTSADVWLKHDATYLYLAVRVHDDTVVPTATNVWDADVVEVFIDVDNSHTPDIGTDRFQIDVNAGGQVASTAGVPGGSWSGAASAMSDGYVVEYRIDKASAGLTGQSSYGFDIAVSDIEPTTSNVETRYFFFATAEASRDESQWGTLEFAPGAPTPLPPTANAGPDVAIAAGGSTPLHGSASGGTSPYTYSWSPATGLSAVNVASPNASPSQTTTYTLTVRDNAGATATDSVVVTVTPVADTTKPTAPTNLAATAVSSLQINLSWTAGTDNVAVTGYQMNRNGTRVGTTSNTSYSDTGLTASTSYTYTVAATDAAGNVSILSAQASATTSAASATPTLAVAPLSLDFGSTTTSLTFQVWNGGTGTLTYTIAEDPAWLSVSPNSGTSTGERDTITATVNRAGLSPGSYPTTIRVTGAASTANVQVTMSVGGGGTLPAPSIVASRVQGFAPFAVFFEGTGSQDSNGKSIDNAGLLGTDLEYTWTFLRDTDGDGNGDLVEATASDFNAAYVFEPPGPTGPNGEPSSASGRYTVELKIRDRSGREARSTQPITVNAFTGTTYYVRADGDDTHSGIGPSPAEAWKTYTKGFGSARNGNRVLFRRGDTFTYTTRANLVSGAMIGAYGTGNLPLVQFNGTGSGSSAAPIAVNGGSGVTISDMHFSLESPVNGNRAHGFSTWNAVNLLILRVTIEKYFDCIGYADGLFVVNSTLSYAQLDNIFYEGSRIVLLDNQIGPARDSHNIYGSRHDRAVIQRNTMFSPKSGDVNIRLGANNGTSRNAVVSDNRFDGGGTWLAVHMGISSDSWDETQHFENLLFERNTLTNAGLFILLNSDFRDTVIRNNQFQGGYAFEIGAGNRIPDDSGFDGPRGVWFYENGITNSGGSWFSNGAPSSQDVYLWNNIVNAQLVPGILPP